MNFSTGSRLEPPDVPCGLVDFDYLADLMGAITGRMLAMAQDETYATQDAAGREAIAQIKDDIRDCAGALEQMHNSLLHELKKHSQLKLDVVVAQAALARQHVELLGTRAQERRARHLARHDSLTLLPNRFYFSQRLDQALAGERGGETAGANCAVQPAGLAVLFLDLDGFKQVNDTHGHDVGDQVLKIVATRLRQTLRAEDMVGRLGGDEFACVLADFPDRAQIAHQAGKLFDAVGLPMVIGPIELVIWPSIGIAVSPEHGSTAEELLKHADAAMYQTKRTQSGFAFLA